MSEQKFRTGDRVTVKGLPWMGDEACTVLCTLEHGIVMVKRDNPEGCIRYFPFLYIKPDEVDLCDIPGNQGK
jgi:hypothetical protein